MNKSITILFFLVFFHNARAQYFIPMFNANIDTMGACHLLITDTANNYLYIGVGDSVWNNRYVIAYDSNTLHQTNFPANQYADIGCATESGITAIINQIDLQMLSIDGLSVQSNIYGFNQISGFGTDVIKTRNDTIFYDRDMGFSGDQIVGITPLGTSFILGVASGGGGISDLVFYNGYLYASGSFTSMNGDTSLKYICYWDGSVWQHVTVAGIDWGGLVGIQGMRVFGSNLIGFGNIDSVNNIPSKNIAMYDGLSWYPITGIKNGGGGGQLTTVNYIFLVK